MRICQYVSEPEKGYRRHSVSQWCSSQRSSSLLFYRHQISEMVSRLFVFVALLAVVVPPIASEKLSAIIPCKKGKEDSAILKEVRVTPCPQAANRRPCVLKKGTNVSIEVDFTPTVSADNIVARAFWAGRKLELPLPGMNTDACSSLSCPLQANTSQTYRYELPISRSFPTRRYDVKWKLNSGPFNMCFQFPIQIVN